MILSAMWTLLLVLTGSMSVSASITADELPLRVEMLAMKMERLESVISLQNQRISDQGTKLALQATTILRQEKMLLNQQSKLQEQEDLLEKQIAVVNNLKLLLSKSHKTAEMALDTQSPKSKAYHKVDTLNEETANYTVSDGKTVRSDDISSVDAVVSEIGQKVNQLEADIQLLKNSNTQQGLSIQDAHASTFVRWGSSQCGSAAELVYAGVVGGSSHAEYGAASNYLCLTMSPVFATHSLPGGYAHLYGGEYETYTTEDHFNSDPVCAVCRSAFSTTIMIPGTNVCSAGWHLQYSGYLMAGFYGHPAASEFVCVDTSLERSAHSEQDQNGKLLFFTVTQCGSLPCSPYENNKIVLCAVCSR